MRALLKKNGSALLVVLFVISAVMALSYVVWLRLSLATHMKSHDAHRTQLLWLARSAAASGAAGARTVRVDGMAVYVSTSVNGSTVTSSASAKGQGKARVTKSYGRWDERFERADVYQPPPTRRVDPEGLFRP